MAHQVKIGNIRAMGLRRWALRRVNVVAVRVADLTHPIDGGWRPVPIPDSLLRVDNSGSAWSAVRPRRFRTIEDLARLCADLADVAGVVSVSDGNSNREFGGDWTTAAHSLAHGTPEERRRVHIHVAGPADPGPTSDSSYTIEIVICNGAVAPNGERLTDTLVIIASGNPRGTPEAFTRVVDRYTIPLTRREIRKREQVIWPLDIDTAEQRGHDSLIAKKAARVGGRWGFAGGVIGGVLSGWLAAALANVS